MGQSRIRPGGVHAATHPSKETRMTRAIVAGVGMVPFTKPGAGAQYDVMGADAVRAALADAGVDYAHVQQAYVGYVYGDSTCGPGRALRGRARPASRSSTSTTTARPARPRCSWRARRSRPARPTACSRSASSRCSRARSRQRVDRPAERRSRASTRSATSVQGMSDAPLAAQILRRRRPRPHGALRHDAARRSRRSRSRRARTRRTTRYAVFRDPVTARAR